MANQLSSGASPITSRPGASVDEAIIIFEEDSSDCCSSDEAEFGHGVHGDHSATTLTSGASSCAMPQGHHSPIAMSGIDVLFGEPVLSTEKTRIPLDASVSDSLLRGVIPSDQEGLIGLGISFPPTPEFATTPTLVSSGENETEWSIGMISFGHLPRAVPQNTNSSIAHSENDVLCSEHLSSGLTHPLALRKSARERLLRATAPDGQIGGPRITVFSVTAGPSAPSTPVDPASIVTSALGPSSSGARSSNEPSVIKKQHSGHDLSNTNLFSPRHVPGPSGLRDGDPSPNANAPSSAVRHDAKVFRAPERKIVAPPPISSSGINVNFGFTSAIVSPDKPKTTSGASVIPVAPSAINRAVLKRNAGASPPGSSSSIRTKSSKVSRSTNPTLSANKSEQNMQNKRILPSLDVSSSNDSPLTSHGPRKPALKRQKRCAATGTRAEPADKSTLEQFDRAFDVPDDLVSGHGGDCVSTSSSDSAYRAGHKTASGKAGVGQNSASSISGGNAVGADLETTGISTLPQFAGSRGRIGRQPFSGVVTPQMMEEAEEDESEPDTVMSPNVVSNQVASSQHYWRDLGQRYAPFGNDSYHDTRNQTNAFRLPLLPAAIRGVDSRPSLGSPIHLIGEPSFPRRSNALLDAFNAGEPGGEEDDVEEDQKVVAGNEHATIGDQPYIAEAVHVEIAGLSQKAIDIMGVVAPKPVSSSPVPSKQSARASQSTRFSQSTRPAQQDKPKQRSEVDKCVKLEQKQPVESERPAVCKHPIRPKQAISFEQPAQQKSQSIPLNASFPDTIASAARESLQASAKARTKATTTPTAEDSLTSEDLLDQEIDNEITLHRPPNSHQRPRDRLIDIPRPFHRDTHSTHTSTSILRNGAAAAAGAGAGNRAIERGAKKIKFVCPVNLQDIMTRVSKLLAAYNNNRVSGPLSLNFANIHSNLLLPFMTATKMATALDHIKELLDLLMQGLKTRLDGFLAGERFSNQENTDGVREMRGRIEGVKKDLRFLEARIEECELLVAGPSGA